MTERAGKPPRRKLPPAGRAAGQHALEPAETGTAPQGDFHRWFNRRWPHKDDVESSG